LDLPVCSASVVKGGTMTADLLNVRTTLASLKRQRVALERELAQSTDRRKLCKVGGGGRN
jgi:hypothetical protein